MQWVTNLRFEKKINLFNSNKNNETDIIITSSKLWIKRLELYIRWIKIINKKEDINN
jgi:hypothetical protein